MCCFGCAVSRATWLLSTSVSAPCIALCVPCPGPLGSCSPVCPLGVLFCLCGVLGHLASVHQCARLVCCFACAVSWANCLLFTGVPAQCVVLLVWCPGPLGFCSPVCPPGALFSLCGVLGHLPPVHRCACLVRCFAYWVSWATWLLFTGVPAQCVVLLVRCPGPLGSCSPVCPLGALLCVCGVLGHLAPVHRCARWVCCAVGCVCGASLRGANSSIRMVAICSQQGLGTLRALTRPSGRRLFVAGRGWVPSGRIRLHPDGGCSVAGRGCVCCRARTRLSRRRLVLLGTCPRAVVRCVLCALSGFAAPGGRGCLTPVCVPWLWPAACLVAPRGAPRSVRSGRSRCFGRVSRRRGATPHTGGLRPRLYWVAARGTPRPAENRAHCTCRLPMLRQGR